MADRPSDATYAEELAGCSVWLLEDSALEAQIATHALGSACTVEVFVEGTSLLERLATGPAPHVLVLDWQLPGMTGLEVLQFVRHAYDEAVLPVLMLTAARGDSADLLEALAAGANDFVTKPFAAAELRARVRTLTRVRALHDRAQRAEHDRAAALAREHVARAELQARADFERQLIGIVSHDLRSPLNAMVGSAQLMLRRDALDARQRTTLECVLASGERAARLVRDLLDFTEARHGGLVLARGALDLHALARQIVDEAQAAHPGRAIEVAHGGDGAGEWDPDRLAQVVSNLLANALQYSPADTPVRVTTTGAASSVVLEVHNRGTPIAAARLARIFDPMERAAGSDARARGSLGLGLYIVDAVVRAHGGTVGVRSTAEDGTTFTVTLPRRS